MTSDTINDAQTVAGSGEGTLLAGRYRVVRRLGQGGMGSVWLVEDTQLDDMPFAVKMLPSILVSNKRAYAQLKAEALVSLKLVHPNIVMLRAFEENDGNPFLVMDYVDGQTLDDYLAERGAMSEEDALRILKPVAAALDYAHTQGVVHRDVKPANVMIRKDGHPFILDFGIAREIQETLTRVTGKLSSGTLLYMSPEQLNGERPKKEQDIYSFAAMVYECLKGEPPFVRGQIEYQILNNPPPPLDLPTMGEKRLAASVMSGLAKRPEDRPKSCVDVLSGRSNRVEPLAPPLAPSEPVLPEPVIRKPKIPLPHARERKNDGWNDGRNMAIVVTLALLAVVAVCIPINIKHRNERKQRELRRAAEIRLESERQAAKAAKFNAESERMRAESVDARTHAYMLWSNAEESMRQASEEFRQGRYGLASTGFTNAAENYRLGAERAEKRRLEIAEEEERQRKLKEEREANESKKVAVERERKRAEEQRTKKAAETAEAERKLAEKRTMAEAEEERRRAMIPKARFVVKIEGNDVHGARISYSGKTVFSPYEISSLEPNQTLGPFAVEYTSSDGGSYSGRFDQIHVDWQGLKIWNFPLSRVTPRGASVPKSNQVGDGDRQRQPHSFNLEPPKKIYAYEARIAPYVMEWYGWKKYVSATIDDTPHDVFVRRETRNGQPHIILGTHSYPEGLFHLKLRYGQRTAQKWISNSMFNSSVVEVELK